MPGILDNINDIFLHHFPGKRNGTADIITPDESRFNDKTDVLSPEFDIKKMKFILSYPDKMESNGLSNKLDKLLWEHYDVFKYIYLPDLKSNMDFTVIFPLLDLFDMTRNERNTSLAVRGRTSKTELNSNCVSWLGSGVMYSIEERFEYWELNMGHWWTDTIATRKYLKELSNPQNGTDTDHLDGYYASNLMERIEWEEETSLTDKSIFIYRILCELHLADKQDLLLLDAEPTNGILRRTLSEFIKTKIKSYRNWIVKNQKP